MGLKAEHPKSWVEHDAILHRLMYFLFFPSKYVTLCVQPHTLVRALEFYFSYIYASRMAQVA